MDYREGWLGNTQCWAILCINKLRSMSSCQRDHGDHDTAMATILSMLLSSRLLLPELCCLYTALPVESKPNKYSFDNTGTTLEAKGVPVVIEVKFFEKQF